MSSYRLSFMSLSRLVGLDKDLVYVAERAIALSHIDFAVIEGLRSMERQKKLVAEGKSQTLNSKHIRGEAIDIAALTGGVLNWEPLFYFEIADAFKQAADQLGIRLRWGGAWRELTNTDLTAAEQHRAYVLSKKGKGEKTFSDLGHYELLKD